MPHSVSSPASSTRRSSDSDSDSGAGQPSQGQSSDSNVHPTASPRASSIVRSSSRAMSPALNGSSANGHPRNGAGQPALNGGRAPPLNGQTRGSLQNGRSRSASSTSPPADTTASRPDSGSQHARPGDNLAATTRRTSTWPNSDRRGQNYDDFMQNVARRTLTLVRDDSPSVPGRPRWILVDTDSRHRFSSASSSENEAN